MSLFLLRIAIRNVRRNFRRSLITAFGVAIGVWMIIFSRGSLNGFQQGMIHGITETRLGDVQVHRRGFFETSEAMPLNLSFPMNEAFFQAVGEDDRVTDVSGRLHFTGLVSVGELTTLFVGMGIDPEHEYAICRLLRQSVLEGAPVASSDAHAVVVGKPLADSLGLKVGDEITVLANTIRGNLNGIDLTVAGIVEYRMPGPGSRAIQMPLETAQKLLFMPGLVNEAVLNVTRLEEVDAVYRTLQRKFGGANPDLNLEAIPWTVAGPQVPEIINEQDQVLIYVILVMYVVMISGIANTMLMAVFERTREIGTLMAMGVKRRRILTLFVLEAAVLGLWGALLGMLSGLATVVLLGRFGMPLPPLGKATQWLWIYPTISMGYMVMVGAIAIAVALLSALYPAWRASRLHPADALSDH